MDNLSSHLSPQGRIAYKRWLQSAFCAAVFCVGMVQAPAARALASDDATLIEGAKLCTRYLPRHERQYGIPEHLLAAIASTESGRYHHALGLNLPWPWTINVEGKGYFFDTKEQAVAAVSKLMAQGIRSIDVGCMQVNLYHHPNAFSSLDQAFDPAYNVAYAAQFLRQNFQDEGSWRKATADYHSRTPMFGESYVRLVFDAWSRIVNKVADARAGRPILNPNAFAGSHSHLTAVASRQSFDSYHSPHLHSISVSHETSRENGVLVIRPQYEHHAVEALAEREDDAMVSAEPKELVIRRAKRTPIEMTSSDTLASADNASDKLAQIVKIRGGQEVGKGQFEPDPHVVHISAAGGAAVPSSPKTLFVFDN